MNLFLIIICNLALMALDILHDRHRADKLQINIYHFGDTVVASLVYLFFNAWMVEVLEAPYNHLWALLPLIATTRWIVHDGGLNLIRGLDWDYLGEGDNRALTDLFLEKLELDPWLVRGIAWVASLLFALIVI